MLRGAGAWDKDTGPLLPDLGTPPFPKRHCPCPCLLLFPQAHVTSEDETLSSAQHGPCAAVAAWQSPPGFASFCSPGSLSQESIQTLEAGPQACSLLACPARHALASAASQAWEGMLFPCRVLCTHIPLPGTPFSPSLDGISHTVEAQCKACARHAVLTSPNLDRQDPCHIGWGVLVLAHQSQTWGYYFEAWPKPYMKVGRK